MIAPIVENKWRLTSYLDVAPGIVGDFDPKRRDQLMQTFKKTFGAEIPFEFCFTNFKCLYRPCTPDDLPVVGSL